MDRTPRGSPKMAAPISYLRRTGWPRSPFYGQAKSVDLHESLTSAQRPKKSETADGDGMEGAVLEVRFADELWYRGRLLERVAGTKPPRWRVQFDDGELRD